MSQDLKVGDWVVPIPEKVSVGDSGSYLPQRQFTRGRIIEIYPVESVYRISWELDPDQTRWPERYGPILWSTVVNSVRLEESFSPDVCTCDFSRGNWSCRCGVGAREISDREASS